MRCKTLMRFLLACCAFVAVSQPLQAQQPVPLVQFADLEARIKGFEGQVLLVNFWATWCGPCVKELPHFNRVLAEYEAKGVKAVFVSLDFADQLETAVVPFATKRPFQGEVVLLDDTDYNSWLPKLSEQWTGAIPATFLYGPGGTPLFFHEADMSEVALRNALDAALAAPGAKKP